ncbi:MAG: spore germination protein [Tissierellales bacterium]
MEENLALSKKLDDNVELFKKIFKNHEDINYRILENIYNKKIRICLISVDSMIDKVLVNDNILKPIILTKIEDLNFSKNNLDRIANSVTLTNEIKRTSNIDELVSSLLYGDAILMFDGIDEATLIGSRHLETRNITLPSSERTINGPKEGFVELISVNISLIRRRIRSSNLVFKFKEIGTESKTIISYCYIEGIVNNKVVTELENRLSKIKDIDAIFSTEHIIELISDEPYSPFDTTGTTERPDAVVGKLLEGRVAILVDGCPTVVTIPFVFQEYFQASEDYYINYYFASINRFIRYVCFFLTISTPALYISLVTFHREMIPTPLLLSIISARQGVPLPSILETLLLLFVFEILREAGVRFPEQVGSAVGIVGALIIGEAAVTARLVSAPIVIVVALTAISGFLVFSLQAAIIIIRVTLLIMVGFLGVYGYIFGMIIVALHLMSLRSFGVPYMLNMTSLRSQDLKDTIIRAPWPSMRLRPKIIGKNNPVRKKTNYK